MSHNISLANKVNNFAVKEISRLSETYNFIFVHISTDYVFDGSKNKPYKEKDKTNPIGAYGKSKLDGEVSIMENNCRSIILRTSWLYSNLGSNFVKKIINLAQEKENIYNIAHAMGYKPKITTAASVDLDISQLVPSKLTSGNYEPDNDYALNINAKSTFNATNGTSFI